MFTRRPPGRLCLGGGRQAAGVYIRALYIRAPLYYGVIYYSALISGRYILGRGLRELEVAQAGALELDRAGHAERAADLVGLLRAHALRAEKPAGRRARRARWSPGQPYFYGVLSVFSAF